MLIWPHTTSILKTFSCQKCWKLFDQIFKIECTPVCSEKIKIMYICVCFPLDDVKGFPVTLYIINVRTCASLLAFVPSNTLS